MRAKETCNILLTSFILAQLRKRRNQRLAEIHARRKGTMYFEASVRINLDLALLCFLTPFDRADCTKRAENSEGRAGPVFGRGRKRIDGQAQVRLEFFLQQSASRGLTRSYSTAGSNGLARPPHTTRTRGNLMTPKERRRKLTKLWSKTTVGRAIRSNSGSMSSTTQGSTRRSWSIGRRGNRRTDRYS